MAVWLVRAGAHGEYEQKFIQDERVYVTWDGLDTNLALLTDKSQLVEEMQRWYPDSKHKAILNWVSQVWPFAHGMKTDDLVVVPLKSQRAIYIGRITGSYHYEPKGPDPFYHWRPVKWVGEAIPRSHFGQDLLYSFGAFMTICRIQRNNAEERIHLMMKKGWQPEASIEAAKLPGEITDSDVAETEDADLEEMARDQIARFIEARFKGHELTRLVEAILRAQGYTTYRSPEGADGGVDILVGAGPLGFGSPRLCVEVKSGSAPVDRPTVDKLLGAVAKFGAEEGLFVSWGGFKSNVQKELATSFFRVRLWSQKELFEHLFAHYEELDDDIRAELPLKRIWTLAVKEDD